MRHTHLASTRSLLLCQRSVQTETHVRTIGLIVRHPLYTAAPKLIIAVCIAAAWSCCLLLQVMNIKNVLRQSLASYKSPTGKFIPKERCWNADCKADVALPCATQVRGRGTEGVWCGGGHMITSPQDTTHTGGRHTTCTQPYKAGTAALCCVILDQR